MRIVPLVLLLSLNGVCGLRADDWSGFRGTRGDAVADPPNAPTEWGPETQIRWKAPLDAPGNGSPVVSGNRLFVACQKPDGTERGLYCFDKSDGRLLWQKMVPYTAEDPTHRTNPFCSSTPAADGKRVVVWHGSAGVHCYDFEGREIWKRDLGAFKHIWGYGSSPVIHAGKVFLNCGPGERTFVVALDAAIGKTLWQADEPGGASGEAGADEWIGSWSTPLVTRVEGRDQVLVSLPYHVKAFDPETGKELWKVAGLGKLVYTTPVVSEGIAIAMGGYHGPAMGFRLGGSGDVTEKNRLWLADGKNPQRIGTGVIVGRHMYMANEQQLAQCLDIHTGKIEWEERLPQGTIWSSIVQVGDRLYVTNQNGTTIVFRADPKGLHVLAENSLGELCNSTIAVADARIYLRTNENLYCIE